MDPRGGCKSLRAVGGAQLSALPRQARRQMADDEQHFLFEWSQLIAQSVLPFDKRIIRLYTFMLARDPGFIDFL